MTYKKLAFIRHKVKLIMLRTPTQTPVWIRFYQVRIGGSTLTRDNCAIKKMRTK